MTKGGSIATVSGNRSVLSPKRKEVYNSLESNTLCMMEENIPEEWKDMLLKSMYYRNYSTNYSS